MFCIRRVCYFALGVILETFIAPSLLAQEPRQWTPPAFESLPSSHELPALFTFADGTKIYTRDDWERRRAEMKAMLLYYQYGRMPDRPDRVTAEIERRARHASGKGSAERLTLIIDSKRQLRMRIALYAPDTKGPYPVVIREEGTLGRTKEIPLFLEKGYMFIEYARHDLDPDRQGIVGPAQEAYPDSDWATLAVWAWGGSRVIDYLETRDDIDFEHIAITGHSRGGKMALLAGALDERFTLVVPNGSGAGGAGSYRVLGPGAESLGMNDKPHWYHKRIALFSEKEERLPFDQHFLKALVAPRALLCTESTDDLFANPLGTQVTSQLAEAAFRFLDADDRIGLRYRRGEHASNTDDWQVLLDFAEWQWFGREVNRAGFQHQPFPVPAIVGLPQPGLTEQIERNAPTESFKVEETRFLRIGGTGNEADRDHFGQGRFGAVSETFEIGAHKVTNAQYAAYLNAVAHTVDMGGLYHDRMSGPEGGIVRIRVDSMVHYYPKRGFEDKPVNYVSFRDAARYCNWLHNGRPKDTPSSRTTEDGAYTLKAGSGEDPMKRNSGARYFVPSENEWYKAAYFDPNKLSYQLFVGDSTKPLKVGEASGSDQSSFGVEQMNDGIWEWTESPVGGLFRGTRSGVWFQGNNRQAAGRFYSNPELELSNIGFRVARASRIRNSPALSK